MAGLATLGSATIVSFVDGGAGARTEAGRQALLVPPAIPPPELIIGAGSRFRAVVAIADPSRFPADAADDVAVEHRPLHDPRFAGGPALDGPRGRAAVGFLRVSRPDADGRRHCLAAVRVFGRLPAVLDQRLAVALAHVNRLVGTDAPIVLYLLPAAEADAASWGPAGLLEQVRLVGHRLGRREVALVVAPGPPPADHGGLLRALPLVLDRDGVCTPNTTGFRGLRPGQRLLTVLTRRRRRPCWQVCLPRPRAEQHRYLELPATLLDGLGGGPSLFGYGRRVTDATVRRLALMARLGATGGGTDADATLWSDADDDADADGAGASALTIVRREVRAVLDDQRALASGHLGDKMRLLTEALPAAAGLGEAARSLGVSVDDYRILLRANSTRELDAEILAALGERSAPIRAMLDAQGDAAAMWGRLLGHAAEVLRSSAMAAVTEAALGSLGLDNDDDEANEEGAIGTRSTTANARMVAMAALGAATTGALAAASAAGADGANLRLDARTQQDLALAATELGALERRMNYQADPVARPDLGNPAEALAAAARQTHRRLVDTHGAVSALLDSIHAGPDTGGGCPVAVVIGGDTLLPAGASWDSVRHAVAAVLVLVLVDAMRARVACALALRVQLDRLETIRVDAQARIRAGEADAQGNARRLIRDAEAAVLRAPDNVSEACVAAAVATRAVADLTTAYLDGDRVVRVAVLRRGLRGLDPVAFGRFGRDHPGVEQGLRMAEARAAACPAVARAVWDEGPAAFNAQTQAALQAAAPQPAVDGTRADRAFLAVVHLLSLRELQRWAQRFEAEVERLLEERAALQAEAYDRLVELHQRALAEADAAAAKAGGRVAGWGWRPVAVPYLRLPALSLPGGGGLRLAMPARGGGWVSWASGLWGGRRVGQRPWGWSLDLSGWWGSASPWGRLRAARRWAAQARAAGRSWLSGPWRTWAPTGGAPALPAWDAFWQRFALPARPVRERGALDEALRQLRALSQQTESLAAAFDKDRQRGRQWARRRGGPPLPTTPPAPPGRARDLIVPTSALRLVVGPVLDGDPHTPALFGTPAFPLVAHLGRFERVVLLPAAVPCPEAVPGGTCTAWLEGCVARGGDVRLAAGQPGPRYLVEGALGGEAILETRADARPDAPLVPEAGCVLAVVGPRPAVVRGGGARGHDGDMLVVSTPEGLAGATRHSGPRAVRTIAVVAARG